MANHQPDTWPATPWIIGDGREADCIYQEGELTPLILVDPSRVMPEEEANATLMRIVACVNAMDGIADPEGFVRSARERMIAST